MLKGRRENLILPEFFGEIIAGFSIFVIYIQFFYQLLPSVKPDGGVHSALYNTDSLLT